MPNKLDDELSEIEKELLKLNSGLRVLRWDGVGGFAGWGKTRTSKVNPHEDTARCDAWRALW